MKTNQYAVYITENNLKRRLGTVRGHDETIAIEAAKLKFKRNDVFVRKL